MLSLPVDLHRARAAIASFVRERTLYRVAVVVLEGEDQMASCGMHVFSLPDAQVQVDQHTDRRTANHLLAALNVYQIGEALSF